MESRQIYFAGSLFCHKDLIGNLYLANSIEQESDGYLRCVLPQNLEQTETRAVDVRNQDLIKVIESDFALFNFDGTDLDSGTIVEFMMAKQLDIPAVILRTDFRLSGDQDKGGDPWNLMCSAYPRTKIILRNGMAEYQDAVERSKSTLEVAQNYYGPMAKDIIKAFNEVQAQPSLFKRDKKKAESVYKWALEFPGGGLTVPQDWCVNVVNRKFEFGLI